MKFYVRYLKILTTVFLLVDILSLHAGSLVHTSDVKYQNANYPFHSGDIVQGFVRLNDGFCVSPLSTGFMDTVFSVSGGFSLNDTGTLALLNNLEFDKPVTLTSHGYINGYGNTIFFNNKFSLAEGKILHISGDTIIDGRDNMLSIGGYAQIFVDTDVTLTLKNLTLQTNSSFPAFPSIRLASHGSKLALDNVIMRPMSDFNFIQGKLFIHNDVVLTGTHSFVYQSTQPSIIAADGHLIFDIGSSFSFCPSTTGDHILAAKDLLQFQDQSSVLMMNGADLLVSFTGLRLTKGTILFDNALTIKTDYALQVDDDYTHTSFNVISGQYDGVVDFSPQAVSWSPDGRNIVVGCANLVKSFKPAGSSFVLINSLSLGLTVTAVAWSPDGRHVAVGCVSGGNNLRILSFINELTGISFLGSAGITFGDGVNTIAWSPDGRYVAVAGGSIGLKIYAFVQDNASSLIEIASDVWTNINSISWSSDGKHIVVGNASGGVGGIRIYEFIDGVLSQVGSGETVFGAGVSAVDWSPDGQFVAAGSLDGKVKTFRRTGGGTTGGLSAIASGEMIFTTPVSILQTIAWSPDGRLITVGGNRKEAYLPDLVAMLNVYNFIGTGDQGGLASVGSQPVLFLGATYMHLNDVVWLPDGKSLLVAVSDEVGYVSYIKVLSQQCFNAQFKAATDGGLVFGNSILGNDFDCSTRLLSGAQINVNGYVVYDCVS